jgi:hypothetical protein
LLSDTNAVHYSSDGMIWNAAPASLIPWSITHAQAALATTDGIYVTDGYHSTNMNVIEELRGPIASAWNDLGGAAMHLSQSTDAKKPLSMPKMFGAQSGLVFTASQFLGLATPDRARASGHYEAWFVGRTLNFATVSAQGPDTPATVIGARNPSNWNSFGFSGDALNYLEYSAGYQSHLRGSGFGDDRSRLYGISHSSGALNFYVGTTQQGSTITTSGFDTSWTGWDAVGAGYREADGAEVVLGAVVVLPDGAASDAGDRENLNAWAKKWGAVP